MALLAVALGACGDCDGDQPADLREFHGDPSGVVCGQRWSYDHMGFVCSDAWMTLRELAPFSRLRSVNLDRTTIGGRGAVPLPSVTSLAVLDAKVPPDAVAVAFPNLGSLTVSGSGFDVSTLPPMRRLTRLVVARTAPPSGEAIARQPALRTVVLSYLKCDACEEEVAAVIRALRPDIDVKTYTLHEPRPGVR
ncbi:MAG: hypothetical protein IPL61_21210 [Myxococcales bacterium]|nr:hypothetical protein [Myxococcales bacterium]